MSKQNRQQQFRHADLNCTHRSRRILRLLSLCNRWNFSASNEPAPTTAERKHPRIERKSLNAESQNKKKKENHLVTRHHHDRNVGALPSHRDHIVLQTRVGADDDDMIPEALGHGSRLDAQRVVKPEARFLHLCEPKNNKQANVNKGGGEGGPSIIKARSFVCEAAGGHFLENF